MDLRRLDRVLEVDPVSLAARIQAGATGPRLEEQLREHGLTLRHFPQSFEYATLGGWIATRAGGHFATLMTHVDDLVESVRAITPRGTWESRRLPGSGAGPSPDRMLIGSEGILGAVSEAWMRVRPRPEFRASCGVEFGDFLRAAAAVREIAQSGLYPSNCRLLDAAEAGLTGAGSGEANLLILGFESAGHPVEAWMDLALAIAREHGGVPGDVRVSSPAAEGGGSGGNGERKGGDAVEAWRGAFLLAPYLRDTFVACGVLSETFETAITWDRLEEFHATVMETARRAAAEASGAPAEGTGAPLVSCRFTHVYPDGAAPYFTVLAPALRGGEDALRSGRDRPGRESPACGREPGGEQDRDRHAGQEQPRGPGPADEEGQPQTTHGSPLSAVNVRDGPVFQRDDLVGQVDQRLVVGGDQGRDPFGTHHAEQQLHDLPPGFQVELAGRLVRDQQARPASQRAGDGHPLLLAAGKLVRAVRGMAGHPR